MANRLATGINVLDRQLDGGIPGGSIVTLEAVPASQSELFLYELAEVRPTVYVTTIRSEAAVRDAFLRVRGDTSAPESGGDLPDEIAINDLDDDVALNAAMRVVRQLPDEANLILDVVDPLERADRKRYREFLNELQSHLVSTGGLAVLHALKGTGTPDNRDTTLHVSDLVFDLQTELNASEIVNRLAIPKFRGGRALEEPIKLRLTEGVTVDTSRDIA